MFLGIEEQYNWIKSLKRGDKIVIDISDAFNPFPSYLEDEVMHINGDEITTKLGLVFKNGKCRRNGKVLWIENPNDDYLGHTDFIGNKINKCYRDFKSKSNIVSYQNKLSLTLNRTWSDFEKDSVYWRLKSDHENALIENQYRDGNKINYFNKLTKCIGFSVKNNSLYKNGEIFIKRCSKKIDKYRVFRMALEGERKKSPKWQRSLVYVYNSETGEIRQETNMSFYYAWYWLEREVSSCDKNFIGTYNHIEDDMAHLLKILHKEK